MLKDQIVSDLKQAMLARDEIRVSTLRMLKAAIMKFEVSGAKKEATEEDVIDLVKKELKARKDSSEQFRNGNRDDLADKEDAEAKILEAYMPEQMNEEQVRAIATEVVSNFGTVGPQDFGKVMGACMGKLKGKADGELVNKVVKELLS
ncbi:glutamyl-tRNA amidotransferase [Candidatus Peregrinibacteria bacterium CG22_combo_CG10-13_8_21_14_all_44_10]|nr:MAG: glutamyl-tRNA amidotransferase [Candidatus Peregrinibacteria bacterium CG2_30_44_17]PIP65912.1 MAG: glutamyl-tRNA amidotransferase [Candidatus Peregrinibacteria bacterium CG22_combo_CG10-13_8_21_14_all_44_10]PIX79762.1 MAG: glutamyl-tRNA amidotransferase [Candidatus Peregrinibacteria bacterium CG_4_10_14_3_um_filter_44_21]PJB88362.1 MAG: glutamyl-tRNA amidotransferase [Candidatus Peregrinibacteria bacterium CG_4_9_14_0_8_um_filter_44_15]